MQEWVSAHPTADIDVYVDDLRVTVTHPQVAGAVAAAVEHVRSLRGMVEGDWGMALAVDKQATLAGPGVSQAALKRGLGKWAGALGVASVLGVPFGYTEQPRVAGVLPKRRGRAKAKLGRLSRLQPTYKSRRLKIISTGVVLAVAYGAEVVGPPDGVADRPPRGVARHR